MELNFGRLATIIKKEFVENRKTLLLRALLLIGSMVILSQIMGIVHSNVYNIYDSEWKILNLEYRDPALQPMLVIFIIGAFFVGAFSASFLFENMTSKTKRLSTLMLPASNAEKFIARFTIFVLGFFVLYFISCAIAEFSRFIVLQSIYPDSPKVHLITPAAIIADLGIEFTKDWRWAFTIFIGAFLFNQSLFGLGSAVWPKNSFIKTFGAIWAISLTFQLLTSIFIQLLDFSNANPNVDLLLSLLTGFLYIGTIFNWVLAYYRFKESEIIQRM